MRKLYFILTYLFSFVITYAQKTENPKIDNQSTKLVILTSVILNEKYTFIELDLSEGLGGFWNRYVEFTPKTYLKYIDPTTKEEKSLRVKSIRRVGDFEAFRFGVHIYMDSFGDEGAKVVYLFDQIPENVNLISLEEKGGWKIRGIHITPREDNHYYISKVKLDSLMHAPSYFNDRFAGEYVGADKGLNSKYVLCPSDKNDSRGYVLCNILSENSYGIIEETALFESSSDQNTLAGVIFYDGIAKGCFASLTEEGKILIIKPKNSDEEYRFLRTSSLYTPNKQNNMWSGTAFAISKDLIITNYHVIDNAKSILIYGINTDFNKPCKVEVIACDKINDLALLKIIDASITNIGKLPYSFKSTVSEVGDNVYVLGYPLTSSMGEEIKLTNGIISAKSGFEGNLSQYQISAPVQPGNSGGPLIDKNGNVIGVICAKHTEAENAAYAVKMSQVNNLIESVFDDMTLNKNNELQGKSLQEQVKSVSKFVYIVKCTN